MLHLQLKHSSYFLFFLFFKLAHIFTCSHAHWLSSMLFYWYILSSFFALFSFCSSHKHKRRHFPSYISVERKIHLRWTTIVVLKVKKLRTKSSIMYKSCFWCCKNNWITTNSPLNQPSIAT